MNQSKHFEHFERMKSEINKKYLKRLTGLYRSIYLICIKPRWSSGSSHCHASKMSRVQIPTQSEKK